MLDASQHRLVPFLLFFEWIHEHKKDHAGRLGRPQHPSQRTERPQSLPLVQFRGSQGTRDVLFGLVRGRMALAQRSRLYSRKSTGTRPWRLRQLRNRLPACRTAIEATSGRGSLESPFRLGASGSRAASRKTLWDADHILPVVEGGGECDLENIRTLCLKCHRAATAELRKRRTRNSSSGFR